MADYIRREVALEDFESCNAENPNWTPRRVKTFLLRQPAADVAEVRNVHNGKNQTGANTTRRVARQFDTRRQQSSARTAGVLSKSMHFGEGISAQTAGRRWMEETAMRPIDADAVYNEALENQQKGEIEDWEFDSIINYLDGAPTINTVEIVYCKDCEHAERYDRTDGTAGYYCGHPRNTFTYGERWERVFKPAKEADDFCSYGGRRGGGNDHVSD